MPFFNSVLTRRTFGFLLAGTVALLAIVFASLWLTERTQSHADELSRARNIRTVAGLALSSLVDAETSQRGYLLTEAQRYLSPYEAARPLVLENVEKLRSLVAQNPASLAKVDQLIPVVNGKLAELAETIDLARRGQRAEALAFVNSDRGKQLMDQARALLSGITDDSEARVTNRLGELNASVGLLTWTTLAGSLVIVLFVAGAGYTVMLYTRGLVMAQREVEALNASLEDRVKERTSELSRANDEIQRFAYIVSHDLRSPLVNIMGFTAELEAAVATVHRHFTAERPDEGLAKAARVAIDEDCPEAVRFIRASTGKMDGLINAILKLSREGRRELHLERVDVGALIAQAAASMKHQLDDAGAEISLPEGSFAIVSDRVALEQVIGNLLDNAVKYLARDRPGRIAVQVSRSRGRLVIDVIDNGRGIAPNDHERIFELFRRAGAQDRPGEGIGLAHVRALVRRLGGDITVRSEVGRGSTFEVNLPLKTKFASVA
jgi:signal transduction histidine kinase